MASSSTKNPDAHLRMRVFAGPNGSGKSTVIKYLKDYRINNKEPIDFGVYINADDIARKLREDDFSFDHYGVFPLPTQS